MAHGQGRKRWFRNRVTGGLCANTDDTAPSEQGAAFRLCSGGTARPLFRCASKWSGELGRRAASHKQAMTGLWVALSLRKTVAEIRAVLENWFPESAVVDWDLSSWERAGAALKDPATATADILFHVENNESAFPTGIHVDRFPGPQDEAVVQPTMIELARLFATTFDCRTMCDGSAHGDDESPYWTIIWDKGRSYLASDRDTESGDQASRVVQVVREISLPLFRLDGSGQLIG